MSNPGHEEKDFYHDVFSGYFHGAFEISTFLLNQFVGCDLLMTFVSRVGEDKVRAKCL